MVLMTQVSVESIESESMLDCEKNNGQKRGLSITELLLNLSHDLNCQEREQGKLEDTSSEPAHARESTRYCQPEAHVRRRHWFPQCSVAPVNLAGEDGFKIFKKKKSNPRELVRKSRVTLRQDTKAMQEDCNPRPPSTDVPLDRGSAKSGSSLPKRIRSPSIHSLLPVSRAFTDCDACANQISMGGFPCDFNSRILFLLSPWPWISTPNILTTFIASLLLHNIHHGFT